MRNPLQSIIKSVARAIVKSAEGDEQRGWTPIGSQSSTRINRGNLLDNNKNWVFVAVDKISTNISKTRIKLLKYNDKGKEDEEVQDSIVLDLLSRPNKSMTGKQFIYVTSAHLELTGNAYWKMTMSGKKVLELFPLNPKYMSAVWNDDRTQVIEYKYKIGVNVITYSPDIIFHLKKVNISNPLEGMGTLENIAEWVDIDNYMIEFNRKFFVNGATMGGMIETEGGSQINTERLAAEIKDRYTGVANSHNIGVLPPGVKFNESASTLRDMEFSTADGIFRDKVLSGFGVPKSVVGITEAGSSRADADAKNYVFQEFTIKPKLESLCDYLTEFFLPIVDPTNSAKQYISFDDPTPESRELQLTEDQASLGNAPFKTVNEVRAGRGLKPVEGGDYVYGNPFLAPIGSTIDMGNEDTTTNNSFKRKSFFRPKVNKIQKVAENIVDKTANILDKYFPSKKGDEPTERRKVFGEQHKEFVTRVSSYEDKLKIAILENDRHQQADVIRNLQKVAKAHKGIKKSDIMNTEEEVQSVIDLATPLMKDLYTDQGKKSLSDVATDVTFSFNQRSETIIARSVARMAKSYTRTTLDMLINQLNIGISAGEGIDKLTKRVQGVYSLSEEYRAARVARTETFSAANDATREAYKQSGVVKSVEWYTADDELVCEFCGPLDGKQVGLSESFFSKGDTVEGADGGEFDANYETIQNPPLHVNCRCEIKAGQISIKEAPIEVKKDDDFLSDIKDILTDDEQ